MSDSVDGWKQLFSEKYKRSYWKNIKSGEVLWNKPQIIEEAENSTVEIRKDVVSDQKGEESEGSEVEKSDDGEGDEHKEEEKNDNEETTDVKNGEAVDMEELIMTALNVRHGGHFTKRRGKPGESPERDLITTGIFNAQNRWIYLDWTTGSTKDDWCIVYHNGELRPYELHKGKSIPLTSVTDIYLDPAPGTSLRLYQGEDSVIQLTPIPPSAETAASWFDAIFSLIQLQSLPDETLHRVLSAHSEFQEYLQEASADLDRSTHSVKSNRSNKSAFSVDNRKATHGTSSPVDGISAERKTSHSVFENLPTLVKPFDPPKPTVKKNRRSTMLESTTALFRSFRSDHGSPNPQSSVPSPLSNQSLQEQEAETPPKELRAGALRRTTMMASTANMFKSLFNSTRRSETDEMSPSTSSNPFSAKAKSSYRRSSSNRVDFADDSRFVNVHDDSDEHHTKRPFQSMHDLHSDPSRLVHKTGPETPLYTHKEENDGQTDEEQNGKDQLEKAAEDGVQGDSQKQQGTHDAAPVLGKKSVIDALLARESIDLLKERSPRGNRSGFADFPGGATQMSTLTAAAVTEELASSPVDVSHPPVNGQNSKRVELSREVNGKEINNDASAARDLAAPDALVVRPGRSASSPAAVAPSLVSPKTSLASPLDAATTTKNLTIAPTHPSRREKKVNNPASQVLDPPAKTNERESVENRRGSFLSPLSSVAVALVGTSKAVELPSGSPVAVGKSEASSDNFKSNITKTDSKKVTPDRRRYRHGTNDHQNSAALQVDSLPQGEGRNWPSPIAQSSPDHVESSHFKSSVDISQDNPILLANHDGLPVLLSLVENRNAQQLIITQTNEGSSLSIPLSECISCQEGTGSFAGMFRILVSVPETDPVTGAKFIVEGWLGFSVQSAERMQSWLLTLQRRRAEGTTHSTKNAVERVESGEERGQKTLRSSEDGGPRLSVSLSEKRRSKSVGHSRRTAPPTDLTTPAMRQSGPNIAREVVRQSMSARASLTAPAAPSPISAYQMRRPPLSL